MSVFLVLLYSVPQAHAQGLLGFYTNLSGAEEVPPINTNASGLAVFLYNNDSSQLSYLVNVTGLEKINQAALHNGPKGVNGEVTVPLSEEKSVPKKENASLMIKDYIKEGDLQGHLLDKKITDLLTLMSNQSAYVNVLTDLNPLGEIRGQLHMGQIQVNSGGDITGLVVRDGVVRLSGVSEKDGKIYYTSSSSASYIPTQNGIVGKVDSVIGGVSKAVENGGQQVKDVTSSVVEPDEGGVTGTLGSTVNKVGDGVQKVLGDDDGDDGDKDSDDSDGKDSDDGDKDSDDEDDDDDGDSDIKKSIKDLLS